MARRAHVYGHPEDSIERVHIFACYILPSDRTPSPNWQTPVQTLLRALQEFHHREFQSLSKVDCAIHPHPIGAMDTAWYRQYIDSGQFFWHMLELVPVQQAEGFHSTLIFADWGMRDNDGQGGDTYLRKRRRQDIAVSDIRHLDGCRGVYLGHGRGAGFISEEAWKHPEIEGSDIVVYHVDEEILQQMISGRHRP